MDAKYRVKRDELATGPKDWFEYAEARAVAQPTKTKKARVHADLAAGVVRA